MAICSATLKKFGAGRVEVATIGRHPDYLHVHLPPRWPGTAGRGPLARRGRMGPSARGGAFEIASVVASLRDHIERS